MHLLRKLFDLQSDPLSLLGTELRPELSRKFLPFLFNLIHPHFQPLAWEQHLPCRIDCYTGKLLYGTLAEHIKASDGLHFIPPKLDAVRIFLRQIKNIHNTASDAELARSLHLIIPYISHLNQTQSQLLFIQPTLPVNRKELLPPYGKRDLGSHQGAEGCDHRNRLSLQHPLQAFDPLRY